MKPTKEYRKDVYEYVEQLLGRPLSFEEHDDLRDMMVSYAFNAAKFKSALRRFFCFHDWKIDKKIEGGERFRLYVKCSKCDKHTKKKMSTRSIRVQ